MNDVFIRSHFPDPVEAVLAGLPVAPSARLRELATLIRAAAEATGTAPLTIALKWGQPSFSPKRSHGTPIRLGWSAKSPDVCQAYVHCQTDLVTRWRMLFPDAFVYEGNRALQVPVEGSYSEAAFQTLMAMALTYHRDKRKGAS